MSLSDAKRALRWKVITEALTDAGLDQELIDLVERARLVQEVVHGVTAGLIGGADSSQAKNYIKVEMVGISAPFDRAYVELVRPGGKTSHELRELLRDRLAHVRKCLEDGFPVDKSNRQALRKGLIYGIDETLKLEAP